MEVPKKNRLRRLTKHQLKTAHNNEQNAFDRWISSTRSTKNSTQDDLPSSQLLSKADYIKPDMAQIFAVIDTCSIVKYRVEMMDFVTRLRTLFPKGLSPIKFIISLVVLEELDKCNRRPRQQFNNNNKNNQHDLTNITNTAPSIKKDDDNITDIREAIARGKYSEPPRMFMRFIEEEMRTGDVIISEFDPYREIDMIQPFEIINKDDRILDCAIRSQAFIKREAHHSGTRLILVTEDNIFKTKATTFQIVSFRWLEFNTKFKNFGLNNYITTPQVPCSLTKLDLNLNQSAAKPTEAPKEVVHLIEDSMDQTLASSELEKKRRKSPMGGQETSTKRRMVSSDIMIVKEIINL